MAAELLAKLPTNCSASIGPGWHPRLPNMENWVQENQKT